MCHTKISYQRHYNQQGETLGRSFQLLLCLFFTMNEQVAKAVAFLAVQQQVRLCHPIFSFQLQQSLMIARISVSRLWDSWKMSGESLDMMKRKIFPALLDWIVKVAWTKKSLKNKSSFSLFHITIIQLMLQQKGCYQTW